MRQLAAYAILLPPLYGSLSFTSYRGLNPNRPMHSLFLAITSSRVWSRRFLANWRIMRSNETRIASVAKAAACDPMSVSPLNPSSASVEIRRLATWAMKMTSVA